jgi:hypothetical protein
MVRERLAKALAWAERHEPVLVRKTESDLKLIDGRLLGIDHFDTSPDAIELNDDGSFEADGSAYVIVAAPDGVEVADEWPVIFSGRVAGNKTKIEKIVIVPRAP